MQHHYDSLKARNSHENSSNGTSIQEHIDKNHS
jgi:hypothetical protein